MISDGILEAMPGNTRKRRSWNLSKPFRQPAELAEQILAFASGLSDGGVVDDCTVLVGTVLETWVKQVESGRLRNKGRSVIL